MLLLRRAELERQIDASQASLTQVEAHLRAIEREDELADDVVLKTAPAQRLLAVERPIPGFGPGNIAPVLNPAYDELRSVAAGLGLSPDRVYLSCYDVDTDKRITMFVGTRVPDNVTAAPEPAQLVLLPGAEVASCVRQGTTREVWPCLTSPPGAWSSTAQRPRPEAGAGAAPPESGLSALGQRVLTTSRGIAAS